MKRIAADDFKKLVRDAVKDAMEELKAQRIEPDEEELEEEETADPSPLLMKLRQLRPAIEASGDRKAIDAYNTAVKAARRQTTNLISALDALPQRSRTTNADSAAEFEQAARRAGAWMRGEPEPVAEETRPRTHAEDATARNDDEAWGRRMNREGQRRRGALGPAPPEPSQGRAQDRQPTEEPYEDLIARRRRELLLER